MSMIDKYFQKNQARNTITVCNDLIVINGAQWSKAALIEAIDDLAIALQNTNKFSNAVEYASIKARYTELLKIAAQNNINVDSDFRTIK